MILRKLKIGTRLAVGFGAVLFLMVGVSLGTVFLDKVNRDRLAATIREHCDTSVLDRLAIG